MDSGFAPLARPGMTGLKMTDSKSQGAADRHIGCAQHDRPSTGGGGKDGRPPCQSATAVFVPFGRRLRTGNTPAKFCRSGSRLGEKQETSERLSQTNVAAALNGLG